MLGDNLLKYRKLKRVSQTVLAKEINVTRQAVSNWERNISEPDIKMLKKLAEVLDVELTDLLDSSSRFVINYATLRILLICNGLIFISHAALLIFGLCDYKLFLAGPAVFVFMTFPLYLILNGCLKSNDYSIMAGYNPKKESKKTMARKVYYIVLFSLVLAFVHSSLFFAVYALEKNEAMRAAIVLLYGYIISFIAAALAISVKIKNTPK